MKIEIKLIRSVKETAEGFPLVVSFSHRMERKQKLICYCKDSHFSESAKMITSKHPEYDLLVPILMDYKLKAKRIVLSGCDDVNVAYAELFKYSNDGVLFLDFAQELVAEMNEIARKFDVKKDVVARNRIAGNATVYKNFINQVKPFVGGVLLKDIDYDVINRFKNYQVGIGNSKNTVHQYLRTFRAIYNKGILKYALVDVKPFAGVFGGLKVKSYQNKKKYLTKDSILLLEQLQLKTKAQLYVDIWLLQFYFGGCDLIDLYYLKRMMVRKGRIYFERGKTGTGMLIDLKIHPKAEAILAKLENTTEWLIAGRKDVKGYHTFRTRYAKNLIQVQQQLKIDVMPTGGNIGSKVARHTFATMAKNLNLEPDLIRELMGHERDDVDQYYKDRFPEAVRDEALYRVIS
jgi:hypothetical protein